MATHGRKAQLFVGPPVADSPAPPATEQDWEEIGLVREGTFNRQKGEIEVTTRSSGMDDEFIPGHRNATYDATGLFSEADDGIRAILDNFAADDEVIWFRDRPKGTGTGLPEYTFQGFVTNATVAMPSKEAETVQITIRVSGAVTRKVQA